MSKIAIESVGAGIPVVLVHGSLATGTDEWEAQLPLADDGFQLLILDRRGYGQSPPARGEDFVRDGVDITDLIHSAAAHLVGHSYGGLGAMMAAAARPQNVLSLTLLEPPTFGVASGDAAVRQLDQELQDLWSEDLPDEDWLTRFLRTVGTDPATLPSELVASLVPLVPLLRHGRPPWDTQLPLAELAATPFPKLVVSGGHSRAFDAMCDELASQIGGSREVVPGAGHEIQFTGPALNRVLLKFWDKATWESRVSASS